MELSIFCTEYESTEQPNVDWGRAATKKMCLATGKCRFSVQSLTVHDIWRVPHVPPDGPRWTGTVYVMRPKRCLPGLDSHSSEDPHDPVD